MHEVVLRWRATSPLSVPHQIELTRCFALQGIPPLRLWSAEVLVADRRFARGVDSAAADASRVDAFACLLRLVSAIGFVSVDGAVAVAVAVAASASVAVAVAASVAVAVSASGRRAQHIADSSPSRALKRARRIAPSGSFTRAQCVSFQSTATQ
jgi:hypothetical protein